MGICALWKHAFYVPGFSSTIELTSRKHLERLSNLENENKRRNRLHIIAEILTIAKEGCLKTQIMYRANLSFTQLNEYLSFLVKMHLLKIQNEKGKRIYITTAKGNEYVEKYKAIADLLENNEETSDDST